jgi:hypothetical protein
MVTKWEHELRIEHPEGRRSTTQGKVVCAQLPQSRPASRSDTTDFKQGGHPSHAEDKPCSISARQSSAVACLPGRAAVTGAAW